MMREAAGVLEVNPAEQLNVVYLQQKSPGFNWGSGHLLPSSADELRGSKKSRGFDVVSRLQLPARSQQNLPGSKVKIVHKKESCQIQRPMQS